MRKLPTLVAPAAVAILLLSASAPPALAQTEPYIGQIMCAPYNFAPRGWAALDGQLLSITQNIALFSLIGTTYGGNGQTTFGLPDMRGRLMLHPGQGPGLSPRVLGETAGTESVTLTAAQMPSHSHGVAVPASSGDGTLTSPANAVPAGTKGNAKVYAAGPGNVPMAAFSTATAGTSAPVGIMPPFVAIQCFIALQGVYPSRD